MPRNVSTVTEAAAAIGCDASTVRRWCIAEGIGEKVAGVRLLSKRDIARLRKLVRPGPGKPPSSRKRPPATS